MGRVVILLVGFFLSSSSMASPEAGALAFVEKSGVGKNLSNLALMTAHKTQTYYMIVYSFGINKAEIVVKNHVEEAVKKYQAQWNKNLALSYLEHFSEVELNSLALEKSASPYHNKFLEKQRVVGTNMQFRSQGLLQTVVSEAMINAFNESNVASQ